MSMSSVLVPHPQSYKDTKGGTTMKSRPCLSTVFTVLFTVVTKPMPHPMRTIAAAVAGRSFQAARVCPPARH